MKTFRQLMIITGLFAMLASIPAAAFDGAILKGIEINSPDNQSYRIIIKTDKDVPIKKYITDANKVVLDLENVRPADFVKTLYNNATEIDHVIVQTFSGNKLRIFLQGQNIAAGKIILDTRGEALSFMHRQQKINYPQPATIDETQHSIIPAKKPETTSAGPLFIDLSDRTVDKVKSVTPMVSYAEKSKNNFKSVQNSMNSGLSMGSIFEASVFDWILRFVVLAGIIIAGIKFFSKPKNIEISLSSEKTKAREMELLKAADTRKELLTKSLGFNSMARKPLNASTSQYGIREYQNSQIPPRKKTTTSIPERPTRPAAKQPKPQIQNTRTAQSNLRQATETRVTQKQTQKAQENFDGARFLETMASIYQKSGRDDLATGIRQNLIRKNAG